MRVLGGIVFQIGVLNDDEVASGFLDAAAQSGAFAHVAGLEENPHLEVFLSEVGQDVTGAVA